MFKRLRSAVAIALIYPHSPKKVYPSHPNPMLDNQALNNLCRTKPAAQTDNLR